MHSLAFVCTFPVLTGWSAAGLESLLTESVGSAGYFYLLACVREQVEALWATTRSHGDESERYAANCERPGHMSRSERPIFTKTQHVMIVKSFSVSFLKHYINSLGKKRELKEILQRPQVSSNLVFMLLTAIYLYLDVMKKSIEYVSKSFWKINTNLQCFATRRTTLKP